MNAIALMMEKHKYIKRMLAVVRKLCINILNGKEIDYDGFEKAIDFIRNYADKHHHSKEEDILFKKMSDELGREVSQGTVLGMFMEHDLGRLYIRNLEEALQRVKDGDKDSKVDIIANAISYTHLLNDHIHKEDNAIYKFAERSLSKEALEDVEAKSNKIEKNAKSLSVQDKYIKLVEELESRV